MRAYERDSMAQAPRLLRPRFREPVSMVITLGPRNLPLVRLPY